VSPRRPGRPGVDARAALTSGGGLTFEQLGAVVAGRPFRLETFVDSDGGTAMSYKVTQSLPAGIEVV
jgi:hypothetical protein